MFYTVLIDVYSPWWWLTKSRNMLEISVKF